MDDFEARLEALYQRAFQYRSIVDDPSIAASAKRMAKAECDDAFYRLADIYNEERQDLLVALSDAIKSPMGVVPKSADQFYDGRSGTTKPRDIALEEGK